MKTPIGAWIWLSAGLFVVLVSVGACVLVHRRRPTSLADYLLGSGAWVVGVALKVLAAVAVFGALRRMLGNELPWFLVVPVTGLLTGIFECGTSALVVRLSPLRRGGWNSALAFGTSFGAVEGVVLAVPFALAGAAAITALGYLEPTDAKALVDEVSDVVRPLTFALERLAALAVHVFAGALVVQSVSKRRPGLFWWSFLLKSAVDALPEEGIPQPVLEGAYVAFGVVSVLGLRKLRAGFDVA
jgi:uncharacterized membrane protein YhfC